MIRVRDPLARFNERIKLLAGFVNAIGLGLVGFAVLRPLTEDPGSVDSLTFVWGSIGLAMHGLSHYVLGHLMKEIPDDAV